MELNIDNEPLQSCCSQPVTGFFRDGFCKTGELDYGKHTICAKVTNEFLEFTKSKGNDLTQANPQANFPGLKSGDKWCLCAGRWLEAYNEDCAPPIYAKSTNIKALEVLRKKILDQFRID